jgi:hypothetical protein
LKLKSPTRIFFRIDLSEFAENGALPDNITYAIIPRLHVSTGNEYLARNT